MRGEEKRKRQSSVTATFKVGAIALAFLVIGYQVALFVHKTARLKIEANRDRPDTVFVVDSALAADLLGVVSGQPVAGLCRSAAAGSEKTAAAGTPPAKSGSGALSGAVVVRRNSSHSREVEKVRAGSRIVESFPFDPNTVSVGDLQRLGFSEAQAVSIDNYRQKGGRFRRKSDFAKSYVVSDSVYRRLEKFIEIPKVDINKADSAAFDSLPGIGGWFASEMVKYRRRLGGYSYPEQLMDIYHFDREKYDVLSDLIICSAPDRSFDLWTLPVDSLKNHPYVRSWQTARSIVFYREHNDISEWTVGGLAAAGVLSEENAAKLRRCVITPPVRSADSGTSVR